MDTTISEVASIIHMKYNRFNNDDPGYYMFDYRLSSIKAIDNLPIFALLLFKRNYKKIILCITSQKINFDEDKVSYYEKQLFIDKNSQLTSKSITTENHFLDYTIIDITKALNNLYRILPNLKFNKMLGKFFIGDDIEIRETVAWLELLSPLLKNIELIYDNCVVCAEKTKTKTKCNHSLCYYCWEHIPIIIHKNEEDDEITKQICPICRIDITLISNESDDFDDGNSDESKEEN